MITAQHLRKLCPKARPELVAAVVAGWPEMQAAGIDTTLRISHFLATLAVETGGLRAIDENLNYTAARIRKVWPSRFKSAAAAKPYARNPEALANKVYGSRLGNKGEASGDGWRFRGGGFIQTTGRSNFRAAGYEDDPDALRQPGPGFGAAITFWTDNRLNTLADRDDAAAVRKKVNGGTHGLAEFEAYLAKAKGIFADLGDAVAPKPVAKINKATIMQVQARLAELLYHEVGEVDGRPGKRTSSAIVAFRLDNGLPLSTEIDDALLAALMTAPPREVDKARATATAGELREKGSTIMSGAAVQQAAGGTAGAVAVAEGVSRSGVLDTLTGAGEKVEEVTDALSPFQALIAFLSDYIWVAFGIIGAIVLWTGWNIAAARLADHRSGKTPTTGTGSGDGS
jgi:predicted chitinase